MKRTKLLLPILVSSFFFLISAASVEAAVSKILIVPETTKATIYWTSSSKEPSAVTYGILSGALIKSANDPIPVSFHSVSILNLSPNTTYYFHIVESKNDQPKLTSTFRTLSSSGAGSSVILGLDPRIQFTKNLKLGVTDPEVKQLQIFLNSQGILIAQSGPGSKGLETNYFGPATSRAVSKFQELYAKDILIPNNLTKGTGAVLGSTRAKLNQILAAQVTSKQVASGKPVIQTPSYYSGGGGGGGSSYSPTPSPSPSGSSPSPSPSSTVTPPAAGASPAPLSGNTINTECIGNTTNDFNTTTGLGCYGPNYQRTNTDYGFTIFQPSSDTKIIYVSNSEGDDTNDGLSPQHPVKTIQVGGDKLRSGYPDWLLLKRGDIWNGTGQRILTFYSKGGRSESEKMLISSYGNTKERPKILNATIHTQGDSGNTGDCDNFAIVGLHIERTDEQYASGINLFAGSKNVLLEDLFLASNADNLNVLNIKDGSTNLKIRRSIIVDAYSSSGSHSQGVYLDNIHGLLIEDNIFDHNGWKEGVAGQTIFNHNIYIQGNSSNVIVRNNISARASSHALQQRPGGITEDNLFLQNPLAILTDGGVVRRNVVLDGRDIDGGNPRGMAVTISTSQTPSSEVSGNIIAHNISGTNPQGFIFSEDILNASLHDNIVYDWGNGLDYSIGIYSNPTSITGPSYISNNYFQMPNAGLLWYSPGTIEPTKLVFSKNSYYSSGNQSQWFKIGQASYSPFTWSSVSGETGASFAQTTFLDPSRTISSYNATLGGVASLEAYLAQARMQSKFNWQPSYTPLAANEYIRAGFAITGSIAVTPTPSPSPNPNPTPNPSPNPSPNPNPPPNGSADVTTGLIARYKFDGDANDSVGSSNGTLQNGTTFAAGNISQAISLDGTDDYVNIPNFSQTLLPATMTAWVKVSAADLQTSDAVVFSRGPGSGINVGSRGDATKLGYSWNDGDGKYWTGGPTIPDNKWFLAVLVVEPSQATMYSYSADGLNSVVNSITHSASSLSGLFIGFDWVGDRFFKGQIDDVRIYNRALSVTDVTALYNAGAGIAQNSSRSFLGNIFNAFLGLFGGVGYNRRQ